MRRAQLGMAMLEVLVSVLLFSLGILGLIGLQAQAIQFSVESDMRNRAALLANEMASVMWLNNNSVLDTAAGGANSWDTRIAAALPKGEVTVEAVTDATLPNSADITIEWEPPQRAVGENAKSKLTTRVTLPPPST